MASSCSLAQALNEMQNHKGNAPCQMPVISTWLSNLVMSERPIDGPDAMNPWVEHFIGPHEYQINALQIATSRQSGCLTDAYSFPR